jgi:hypothetical protein
MGRMAPALRQSDVSNQGGDAEEDSAAPLCALLAVKCALVRQPGTLRRLPDGHIPAGPFGEGSPMCRRTSRASPLLVKGARTTARTAASSQRSVQSPETPTRLRSSNVAQAFAAARARQKDRGMRSAPLAAAAGQLAPSGRLFSRRTTLDGCSPRGARPR